jgi:hypothetical protein
MEPIAAARAFVQMEIDAHPDVVGAPIATLTIDRNELFTGRIAVYANQSASMASTNIYLTTDRLDPT